MSRMIDLIRQSAVPAGVMRQAARGALSLPATEMVEILVYLTGHQLFGDQARLTLAGWNEDSLRDVLTAPDVPTEVLEHFSHINELRPGIAPAVADHPRTTNECLEAIASEAGADLIAALISSARVRNSPSVLRRLRSNPRVRFEQAAAIDALLAPIAATSDEPVDPELDAFADRYVSERAAEIEAVKDQPFVLLGANELEQHAIAEPAADASTASAARMMAAVARHARAEKESPVQKIARMTVGERVMLALKGNRDERFLLVRDGARIVSNAVLESPKITDGEIDMFASLKNVHESILRSLGTKRKFVKRYPVIRALTMNPKTPLDVVLALIPHLLTNDLKNLTKNRDVADTVVKAALKLYRERTSAKKE